MFIRKKLSCPHLVYGNEADQCCLSFLITCFAVQWGVQLGMFTATETAVSVQLLLEAIAGTCFKGILVFSPVLPPLCTWSVPRIVCNHILVNVFGGQNGLFQRKMITSSSSILFKRCIWSRTGQRRNVRGKRDTLEKFLKVVWLARKCSWIS